MTKISRKSCSIDPVPAHILKACLETLLPVLTNIVNTSLETATMPETMKAANLEPRIKKVSMDPQEFSSFRPISNLKFTSKAIEKVVADQLCLHANSNNLQEIYQSAYKARHSTETALVEVQNDILRAIDDRNSVILLLIDLSAAFDTVDHDILLSRLTTCFGITGRAHQWFRSYLNNRTLTVSVSGGVSTKRSFTSSPCTCHLWENSLDVTM